MTYAELVQVARGFQDSRALLTAIELDLFTAVGAGATSAEVSARTGTNPRATEMLLNAVTAIGALAKREDVFYNTPDIARFLVEGSAECQRGGLLHTVNLWNMWSTLTDCLRTGTSVQTPGVEAGQKEWTRSFIAAMHNGAAANAGAMVKAVGNTGKARLLDIGGGSGAYSIAFARANPELRAEVLDLAPVIPLTQTYIAEAGLAGRIATRAGDLTRDDFGTGYDIALLSAICHMLGVEENQDLLRRCFSALLPGGRLIVRDFLLDSGKTSPKPAALFSLNMLVATRGGASYSEAEYREWLAGAGFARVERPDRDGDLLVAFKG